MSQIDQAQRKVEQQYLDDNSNSVHTVYQGLDDQGRPCIKVVAGDQPTAQALQTRVSQVDGIPVLFEVDDQPTVSLLRLFDADHEVYNSPPHQQCFSPVIPGGAQIAPRGAGWVGTLGLACRYRDRNGQMVYGCLTNWHVAHGGQFGMGHPICQPHGNARPFGRMTQWKDIGFSGQANDLDIAFIDTRAEDGGYTVIPEQFNLGKINPSPVLEPQVGDTVVKSGRTTGVQRNGQVIGVNATSNVNYGGGRVGRFVDQLVIRNASGGNFSGPGDSGSGILSADLRPYGLLFAGGGGNTIANRIAPAIEQYGVEFFTEA